MNKYQHYLQRGFTLLELVVTIVIIGIISIAYLPKINNPLGYSVQSRAEAFASDLRHAKELAVSGGRCVSVTLNFSGGAYTFVASKPIDAIYPPCNGSTTLYSSVMDSKTIISGPSPALYFNSVGIPSASATYTLTAGGVTKYIGVTALTGLVVVCSTQPCPP
mgnify:CR=1 FL=1